jgi:hypothetical protein
MESAVEALLELTTENEREAVKLAYTNGSTSTREITKALNLEGIRSFTLVCSLVRKGIFYLRLEENGQNSYAHYEIKSPYKEIVSWGIRNKKFE